MNIFEHSSPPINSVLKMFVDLFIAPETANLFYTNDNKVLIDILVRQLSDLSAGDPVSWFFVLFDTIMKRTLYLLIVCSYDVGTWNYVDVSSEIQIMPNIRIENPT